MKSASTDTVVIRPARPADAARCTELAHVAKSSWGYPGEWIAAWSDDLTLSPEYIDRHQAFVAESGRTLAGMCVLEDHGDHWRMEHVWIAPAFQHAGIGRLLVTHVLAIAREQRGGRVELLADPNAVEFYTRLGARKVADLPAPMPGAPDRTLPLMEFEA